MKKDQPTIQELLQQLRTGQATGAELKQLQQLLESAGAEKELQDIWEQIPAGQPFFSEATGERMLQNILQPAAQQQDTPRKTPRRRFLYPAIAVAATLLLCLLVWRTSAPEKPAVPYAATHTAAPILPGSDKAMLTLSDGTTIPLDSQATGAVHNGDAVAVSQRHGELLYKEAAGPAAANSDAIAYHTLTTPRGGQYAIVLEDGTKVWLNAASSLRYPAAFKGSSRSVTLTGEAYFEVAHDAARPFTVQVQDMQVQVLGTHFNIMSYADEQHIRTTLLSGSVRVLPPAGIAPRIIQPGQQAVLAYESAPGRELQVKEADTEEVMAWKNGLFRFNNADIPTVLRQIARWYDITIEYRGQVPARRFGGKIARNSSLAEIIRILELSHIHCKTENRKLIIMS
jgi:transmembrane sensor